MVVAIVITIFASFLWAITNHIDKFMVTDIDESGNSVKTLLVFSTLVAGIVLLPLWVILSKFNLTISTVSLISMFSAAIVYIAATYFYFIALKENDASIITIMFQLIPVFSYILAFILFKETLTTKEIIGALIIFSSAIIVSIDFKERNHKKKLKALILMTLSSLLFATYFILFDNGIRNSSYYSCAFWYQIGLLSLGLIFLLIKSFRTNFIKALKNNGKRFISLNVTNEVLNLVANLLVNFANITIPIALANVLNGFQGMFVFILGAIGTMLLPKYFEEDLSKGVVIQKVACMIIGIVGLIILVY